MANEAVIQTWLSDILNASALVGQFVESLDFDTYLASSLHVSAVERQLSIVGEAVVQIRKLDSAAPLSNLQAMVGFRNVLIHRYARVSQAVVWTIVVEDLPVLAREAAAWLAELDARIDGDSSGTIK